MSNVVIYYNGTGERQGTHAYVRDYLRSMNLNVAYYEIGGLGTAQINVGNESSLTQVLGYTDAQAKHDGQASVDVFKTAHPEQLVLIGFSRGAAVGLPIGLRRMINDNVLGVVKQLTVILIDPVVGPDDFSHVSNSILAKYDVKNKAALINRVQEMMRGDLLNEVDISIVLIPTLDPKWEVPGTRKTIMDPDQGWFSAVGNFGVGMSHEPQYRNVRIRSVTLPTGVKHGSASAIGQDELTGSSLMVLSLIAFAFTRRRADAELVAEKWIQANKISRRILGEEHEAVGQGQYAKGARGTLIRDYNLVAYTNHLTSVQATLRYVFAI